MKVTAISPGADDPRESGTRTVSQALVAPAPSPLSLLEPDLVIRSAEFFVHAGWAPEDLEAFGGDPEFTAQVMAAMRALGTTGGAR